MIRTRFRDDFVLQRALTSFVVAGVLMAALLALITELRTPLVSGLLIMTSLLVFLRPIACEKRRNSRFRKRVLVIGNRPLVQKFLDEVEINPRCGYSVVGIVEESWSTAAHLNPFLVLGTIDELATIVEAVRPDRIITALSDRRGRMPAELLLEFQMSGIRIETVEEAYERISGKLAIELVTPAQLLCRDGFGNRRGFRAMQRMLSFAAALLGLILTGPLLALIALAIKLDSGGSVLFRQTRLGKGGRPFELIKFRTMQPVDQPASEWAQDNLSRVTRAGSWLRRFRLDELPQLVNVLRGDMNLVGPRPHPVCNYPLFREQIPYYILRGSVLPGITGWAQVRYRYANNLEQETEKMRYDLYYIKHMTLWMDLGIAFSTCRIFFSAFLKPKPHPRIKPRPAPRPAVHRRPAERSWDWPADASLLPRLQYQEEPQRRAAIPAP